jgi:hypothetical protein
MDVFVFHLPGFDLLAGILTKPIEDPYQHHQSQSLLQFLVGFDMQNSEP